METVVELGNGCKVVQRKTYSLLNIKKAYVPLGMVW